MKGWGYQIADADWQVVEDEDFSYFYEIRDWAAAQTPEVQR